ncbi:MAG: AsmA family protein [Bacteroidales bacterium]|nr:AsmA family protein [Bacteroidales bacterium]
MKKMLKISGVIIGLLIVLMITLPFLFKDKIVEIVKEEINNSVNAKVNFEGFALTLFHSFPDFTFEIKGMTVVGVDEFANDTLTAIDNIYINFDLVSVFSSDYKVNAIEISHPVLNLKFMRDGKANWDIVKESVEDGVVPEEVDTVLAEEASAFKMQLQKFEISDAYIRYDDKVLNMFTHIDGLNLILAGDFTESITNIELETSIDAMTYHMDGLNYLNRAKMSFEANIIANLDSSKYTFNKNLFKVNGLGLAFDGFIAMPGDNIVMDLKYRALETSFKSLLSMIPAIYKTDFEGLKTSGKFSMNGWAKGVYNEVSMPAFALTMNVKDAMFQYPDLPEKVDQISIVMKVSSPSSDLDKMEIDVEKFHFNIAKNPMDIKLKLSTPMSDPNIDAQFKGRFDLASIDKIYPLDEGMEMSGLFTADLSFKGKQSALDKGYYSKFKASGSLGIKKMNYKDADLPEGVHIAKAKMDFTPRYISLSDFKVTYNKNTIDASGRLRNYLSYVLSDGTLKGSMNISADYLDFNQMMGIESVNSSTSGNSKETVAKAEAIEEDLSIVLVPDNIDFTVQVVVGRMKYDDLVMKTVYGKLRIAEERVQLDNFHMNMLKGKLIMSGYYSTLDPEKPKVSLVLGITDFDIKKSYDAFVAIQKFAPIMGLAHGSYSAAMSYSSNLDLKMEPMLNTVNAAGLLSMSKVQVKGSKAFAELAKSLNYDELNNVSTNEFDIPYRISDGKLLVKPFNVEVDDIPMTIKGVTYLNQDIDYNVDMQIPRSKLGSSANAMINSLVSKANAAGVNASVGETINVKAKIKGTTTSPVVELNYKEATADIKEQLQDEAQKQIDELKKQAEAELEKQKKELEQKAKAEYEKHKAELERIKKEEEEKAKKKLEEEANKLLDDWF